MSQKRGTRGRPGRSALFGPGGNPLGVFDGLCAETLSTQGREVIASGDPLQAELWASSLVALFSGLPLIGEPDPALAIGGRLVLVATKRSTPEARICLRALAAVAPARLARRARTALGGLGCSSRQEPVWAELIGHARATCAGRASDLWGSQDSLMIGFAHPGRQEHCLVVLVDHMLGGIAKDAAILQCSMVELLKTWDEPQFDLVEEPIGQVASRVMAGVATTLSLPEAPFTEDFTETLALLQARLGPLVGQDAAPRTAAVALETAPGSMRRTTSRGTGRPARARR